MHTIADIEFYLPESGPSLRQIDTLAEQLGRSLDDFIAFSLIEVTRQIFEESGRDDLTFPAEQAVLAHLDGLRETPETCTLRLEQHFPADAPQLEDADFIASLLGLDRAHYISGCLIANYELQKWILEDPEQRRFREASEKAASQLPKGYKEAIADAEGTIVQSHELKNRESGPLWDEAGFDDDNDATHTETDNQAA